MSKRKNSQEPENGKLDENSADESDSGTDEQEQVNVDFEFFDPQEQDFHGIRVLLRQLFDVDATLFDLSALTEIILKQALLGSTVKVDGKEGDPYAFLTVINLQQHRENPSIRTLIEYLIKKSASQATICAKLENVLTAETPSKVGLILTERLLNMPIEIIPPMYNMLLEEIEWAIEEKEPYDLDYYLILSKVYTEVTSKLDVEDARPLKRTKAVEKKRKKSKEGNAANDQCFLFHPEDEILQEASDGQFVKYQFTNEISQDQADSKRAFFDTGIISQGNMMMVSDRNLRSTIQKLLSTYN